MSLPEEMDAHYRQGRESQRLLGQRGELERLRTQAIFARHLPPAPAEVDIGGAAGVHAFHLARQGYRVNLIDPVGLHLEQARSEESTSGVTLRSIVLGDARKLNVSDAIADVVLLLGPLYHLIDLSERLQALREAQRILKPGGVLLAAAISRFASLIDGLSSGFFEDPDFREIIAADLSSGLHRNPKNHPAYFTTAYFHRPEELAVEVRTAGFDDVRVLAVEGPEWGASRFCESWADAKQRERLMEFLANLEEEPSIQGASAHMIAVAHRPNQNLPNKAKSPND